MPIKPAPPRWHRPEIADRDRVLLVDGAELTRLSPPIGSLRGRCNRCRRQKAFMLRDENSVVRATAAVLRSFVGATIWTTNMNARIEHALDKLKAGDARGNRERAGV